MEHISNFLRAKFDIDVPPDYLSVHLPHDVPLPGHYSLLELTFLCDILDGDMMAFSGAANFAAPRGKYDCPGLGSHL